MNKMYLFLSSLIISLGLVACGGSSSESNDPTFSLKSSSFSAGSAIPSKYSKNGANISPQLEWENAPTDTKSFAIIMDDLDAEPHAGKTWVHWNVFDISNGTMSLAEDASLNTMPAGSIEGMNSYATASYGGPNPPSNDPDHDKHTYNFFVYALNVENLTIDSSIAFDRAKFEADFSDKIMDKASFTATYTK